MENDELKYITESLYKQNTELAVKNKTLSLLGKLYEISIIALEPKELASRINNTIQVDFSFELVGIFLYDQIKDELSPLAFAKSDRFHQVESNSHIFFEQISIPNVLKNSLLKKVLEEKVMVYTEDLKDILDSLVQAEMFEKIKSDGHVQSSILYPLIIEDRVIGLLMLGLNRIYADLVDYEKEAIKAFINVIAVALDKALLYQQLKITNKQLEIANEQQKNLIHFISHEVKGFLSKSRNIFSMMIGEDFGLLPEYLKNPANEGLSSGTKGIETVQQILNASNLKKGTVQYKMEPFDLKTVLNNVILDLKKNAEAKNLSFQTNIEDDSYEMTGDADQIKHVLKNLVDNAIRYTLKGGIEINLNKENGKIIFSIKDSGVGITAEDRDNLFIEGMRGKDSLKVNVESTGYGLFIAKKIAEDHNGRIWVQSEGQNLGSTFFVEFEAR